MERTDPPGGASTHPDPGRPGGLRAAARPRPRGRGRADDVRRQGVAAGTGAGGRVRPDVLTGEVSLDSVGPRPTGDRQAGGGCAPRGSARDPGDAGGRGRVHPCRQGRHPPGPRHRPDRGGLRPPRLPHRGPGPAHPRRSLKQGAVPARGGRAVADPGRADAVQGQGDGVRALQHPPRGRPRRAPRRPLRRPPHSGGQARGAGDRRDRPGPARGVVVPAAGDRGPAARARLGLPGRPRAHPHDHRVAGPGAAGEPGDPPG